MLKGNVLANKGKLYSARDFLLILKNRKLAIKAEEHEKDPEWELGELIKHLESEVRKFEQADGFFPRMGELADISNMVDILAMKILDEMRRL